MSNGSHNKAYLTARAWVVMGFASSGSKCGCRRGWGFHLVKLGFDKAVKFYRHWLIYGRNRIGGRESWLVPPGDLHRSRRIVHGESHGFLAFLLTRAARADPIDHVFLRRQGDPGNHRPDLPARRISKWQHLRRVRGSKDGRTDNLDHNHQSREPGIRRV